MDATERWLDKLFRLRVHGSTDNPAPHKPLLLMVLFDLAELGQLPDEVLPLTGELTFKLTQYWAVVAARRGKPEIRYPFHRLRTDGVW